MRSKIAMCFVVLACANIVAAFLCGVNATRSYPNSVGPVIAASYGGWLFFVVAVVFILVAIVVSDEERR